ncbi:MAG: hypothetical protein VXZ96_19050 [Myxococcota bacterium]|nr:hypothetical protein [Myxococcota bacterium]
MPIVLISLYLSIFSCTSTEKMNDNIKWSPSDDPADYDVDSAIEYDLAFIGPEWVVPSTGLPDSITPLASNNNVDIHLFDGRLFMAWRSAPTHFASSESVMWVASSNDMGKTWQFEAEYTVNADLREPRFLSMNNRLQLSFFEAGDNPAAFEPKQLWRVWKNSDDWSELEPFGEPEMVMWDIKVRNGTAYMTTYTGEHYANGTVEVQFWESDDAKDWVKVNQKDHVYSGGVSEVAFEFDMDGNLWAVGRNEDGDDTGAGTQLCHAKASDLSTWMCLSESLPERTDSPELFRHGKDIYLLARRDIGGPFGPDGDLIAYSSRPKAFSIYQLDTENWDIIWLQDLPGVGDTAFPSVRRLSANAFIFANYTSPLDNPDISWFNAQTSPLGTQIYLGQLNFVNQGQ